MPVWVRGRHRGRAMTGRVAFAFALFLPMAAIGTVIHELGHWLAGWAMGGSPTLHFRSTSFGIGHPGWVVVAAGPLCDCAIGTLGAGALPWARARPAWHLLATMMTLFWSRQVFNLAATSAIALAGDPVPTGGDEARLGLALGGGPWPIAVVTGAIGLAACAFAAWSAPREWRVPLVVGGVPACLVGIELWFEWLGPWLLP